MLLNSAKPDDNNDDDDDDLNVDLDADLDTYLLHPQSSPCLRIVHAFMNSDRAIEHVCEETVRIADGVLRQEQLIWCIKQQQRLQHARCNTHFKLRAMFLYNMDLAATEMRDLLRSSSSSSHHRQFLTPVSAVEDVLVRPTIPMFARLNALHIMYAAATPASAASHHCQSKKRVVIHARPPNKQKHTRKTA
jgi:hypothetical protein